MGQVSGKTRSTRFAYFDSALRGTFSGLAKSLCIVFAGALYYITARVANTTLDDHANIR